MNIEQMKIVIKEIITKTDLTPCVVGEKGTLPIFYQLIGIEPGATKRPAPSSISGG